jgi:hypothetical protein
MTTRRRRKKDKIRHLIIALLAALLTTSNVYAEETKSDESPDSTKSPVRQYNSYVSGNFTVRTWLGNNSVDQFITILNNNQTGFINSKQSLNLIELDSNYWFGFITQNQLYNWGPLFGIGVNFTYGNNSFTNLQATQGITADLVTYMLDFDFAKIAVLHDDKLTKYLALSGHYTSFSNSMSGSNPMNGLGVGVDAQYSIYDFIDLYFKLNYIPNASSTRLNSAWGANSELGFKWFISPKAAFNVGYKGIYYTGRVEGQTTGTDEAGKPVSVNVNLRIVDIFHGLTLGGSYYF